MNTNSAIINKLYVNAFYKKNAGLFFFLIVTFLFSLIYINALDKIPSEKKLYWNLIVAIKLFSNPFIATVIFAIALFYLIKAYFFFTKLLEDSSNYFLFQTVGSLSPKSARRVFIYPIFKLFFPLYGYALFGLLIGYFFHFWKIPVLFLGFNVTANLLFIERLSHILANRKVDQTSKNSIRFPVFSNYIAEISMLNYLLGYQKLAILITKSISLIAIVTIFKDENWGKSGVGLTLVALFISLEHAGILYSMYRFRVEYLSFTDNIPMAFSKFYLGSLFSMVIFLLPEWIVLFQNISIISFLKAVFIIGMLILLFWQILDQIGLNLKSYFKLILLVGFLCYFLFLYGGALLVSLFILLYTSIYAYQQYHLKEI